MSIAEAAAEALGSAREDPRTPISIQGQAGTGKTALGLALADRAASEDLVPVLIRPPARAPEAGPIVVGQALETLGLEDLWDDGPSYGRALMKVRWALSEQRDKVVVIADEPSAWTRGGAYFGSLTDEAKDVFLDHPDWPTVVLDQAATKPLLRLSSIPFEPDLTAWGELADAGAAITQTHFARSPLEFGFSAAIFAWGRAVPDPPAAASRLAETLVEVLAERRMGPRLWALWQRLSLARTELSENVLDELGAKDLDPLGADTLKHVLLDPAGRLHDIARVVAERDERPYPITMAERAEVHRILFEHHRELAQSDHGSDAGRHAAEALFHVGALGEEALIDTVPVMFVEQLNALGRELSKAHRDHFNAAAIFLRAIQLDSSNDYAQHYRGFNLDFQGEERAEVAERYGNALDIDPSNPWWHARQVTFLADTGELSAARAAWDRAESQASPGSHADYTDLHSWVAGALLHQGELTFADYVLVGVPAWAETEEIADLRRAVDARILAQDTGNVVPAPRSWGEWWLEGPTMLANRDTEGRLLIGWIAGRVDVVDEDGVHLRAGFVEPDGRRPDLGDVTIGRERWAASCLDEVGPEELGPGAFLELGNYGSEGGSTRLAIRVVRPDPYRQPKPPIMPLNRWIKHGAAAQPAAT